VDGVWTVSWAFFGWPFFGACALVVCARVQECFGATETVAHQSFSERSRIVTEQEIEAKVIDIVAQQMGHDKAKINRTMKFTEDLNADSLDQVELVMELEEAFETDIPDEQAEKIKTVGDAIDFIKQHHGVK
jgi:acyl carrier protein